MKIKSKKSLIAVSAIVLVVAVGITYALIFSTSARDHLFSLGNYNVVTSETFASPSSWQPGVEIPKTITATNNGNIQAAFRVKYTEKWENASGEDITSQVPNNTVSINFINGHDWTYNSDDGYYYYKWIIEPEMTTSSLISGVTLNQDLVSNVSCDTSGNTYNCSSDLSGFAGAHYIITFTKETVAYDKYKAFWNTDLDIIQEVTLSLPEGRTKDTLQVGDEICINGPTTECFNFIRYDGNNIVMLAKYNLNVGSNAKGTATNLQDSDAAGMNNSSTRYGGVNYSYTNYWVNGGNLKSNYGSSYPADIYDIDYVTEPDFSNGGYNTTDYSIAYYVKEYKDMLEDYGVSISDARLLKYSEATDESVGCVSRNWICDDDGKCIRTGGGCPSFIATTSFWMASAGSNSNVYGYGNFSGLDSSFTTYSYSSNLLGVRPVIVISKSDI